MYVALVSNPKLDCACKNGCLDDFISSAVHHLDDGQPKFTVSSPMFERCPRSGALGSNHIAQET